jgi:hypothetical protein
LELDLVQEGVAWFQQRGSPVAHIPCLVEGGRPRAPKTAGAPLFAGFRARHPRLHGALRGLGLVPLYRAVAAGAQWWRETRRRKRRRKEWRIPLMEMYAVPSRDVEHIVASGGGRLLETDTERWPNRIVSARYWVVKQ